MKQALRLLVRHFPEVHVHVVCGDNERLRRQLSKHLGQANISTYGLLDSVEPLLSLCACVVTKPGMGTLLEARAARRKIFLFPGMPVAESHNARHAIAYFDAEWLSVAAFTRWLRAASAAE
jgi:UDP-N-acetylglucosamine:LPS N-acetylglucosamine transferase